MALYDKKNTLSERHIQADKKAMQRVPDDLWEKCHYCHGTWAKVATNRYGTCPHCGAGKRQAARHVDGVNRRMGEILVDMADDPENSWDTERADVWVQETEALGRRLSSVGQAVQVARESARLNPRDSTHRPHLGSERTQHERQVADQGPVDYEEIFARLGEGIATLRNLAMTIRESTRSDGRWDDCFRDQWVGILRDAGRSIHDPHADVEPVQDRLSALAARMSRSDGRPPGEHWPVYGALITGLQRIAVVVDDVASAQEARDPAQPNPQA